MAFDLLDGDDHGQHDDRADQSVGDQCHEHGDRAGGDRTDDGDERSEEDQHCHGDDQRDSEERGTDADADRVDGGDEDLDPHVLHEGRPPFQSGTRGDGAGRDRQQAHHPLEDVLSVIEEEERREQADSHAGEEGAHRRGGLQGSSEKLAAVVLEEVRRGLDRFVDIARDRRGIDAEGTRGQPSADPGHTGDDLFDEVGHSGIDLLTDEAEESEDDDDESDESDRCGPSARNALLVQPSGQRSEQCGQQQSDEHGQHDAGDLRQEPQSHTDRHEDDDRPPRPRGSEFEARSHIRFGLGFDSAECDLLRTDRLRRGHFGFGLGLLRGSASAPERLPGPSESVLRLLLIVFAHAPTIVVDALTKVQ